MSDKQYEPTYEGQLDKCQDERHALQMQLEEYIEAFKFAHKEFHEALDDLAKMKAERDEARRLFCEDRFHNGNHYRSVDGDLVICASPKEIADDLGWDCFKENTND